MKCSVVITPNFPGQSPGVLVAGTARPGRTTGCGCWLGWAGAGTRQESASCLPGTCWRALEHDPPGVLLQLACGWLRAERIVGAPVDALARRVATARDAPALRPITAWTLCCNHRGRCS
jgi:hypothetical protein